MSSITLYVIYGPGRQVPVKTTPATTTLQTVLVTACSKVPGNSPPNPDLHLLTYNGKSLDMTLSVRYANLPPGAKLTLKRRATKPGGNSRDKDQDRVKIALQLIDDNNSGRIILEVPASITLWGILLQAESRSNGTLNLTNQYTVDNSRSTAKKSWKSDIMQKLSPTSSKQNSPNPEEPQHRVYRQPAMSLLNNEYGTLEVLHSTTLRSLGFSKGNVLIRLSFRNSLIYPEAPSPQSSSKPPIPQPKQQQQAPSPAKVPAPLPVVPEPGPAIPKGKEHVQKSPISEMISNHNLRVIDCPNPDKPTARIELPESFYDSDGGGAAGEMKLLIAAQRSRVAESEKGFKNRIKQEKEDSQRHQQLKQKYATTRIRFKFPDQVQVEAAFQSTKNKVADLFTFISQVTNNSGVVSTLAIQPPFTDLAKAKDKTLFDAKLSPAALVHVRLLSPKLATRDILNPEANKLMENLDVHVNKQVAEEEKAAAKPEFPLFASSAASPAPSDTSSKNEKKVPKWFTAGYKKH